MKTIDLTGNKYGRLTVTSYSGKYGHTRSAGWLCLCKCGEEKIISSIQLRTGKTNSCGCLLKEKQASGNPKHGHGGAGKHTREYRAWYGMRTRCGNPNSINYKHYGARGIKVCGRWNEFKNFLADMGPHPGAGYSIDRIDNNGNYEPGNCRWATRQQQLTNKRPWGAARKTGYDVVKLEGHTYMKLASN